MIEPTRPSEEQAPPMEAVATVHPPSPPLEEVMERFWEAGAELETIPIRIEPPDQPMEVLEQLGPSPFPRGPFPLIGFLATTYEKVSRYALRRG